MLRFALGFACASLFAEVFTHYGWAARGWNDWTAIMVSIFSVAFCGLIELSRTFAITRRPQ